MAPVPLGLWGGVLPEEAQAASLAPPLSGPLQTTLGTGSTDPDPLTLQISRFQEKKEWGGQVRRESQKLLPSI